MIHDPHRQMQPTPRKDVVLTTTQPTRSSAANVGRPSQKWRRNMLQWAHNAIDGPGPYRDD